MNTTTREHAAPPPGEPVGSESIQPYDADDAAGMGSDVGCSRREYVAGRIRECEANARAWLAEQLRWVGEASRQGLYAEDGARSTRSWLRELLNLAEGEAATRVRVAEAIQPRTALSGAPLEPTFPATADAVRAGAVSLEHARVIVDGVEKLSPTATDTERDTAEHMLAEQARTLSPRQVRTSGERIRYLLDQDGVFRDEQRQYAARELHLGTGRDGMTLIRGRLDRVAGAQLSAVLESLASPQPAVDGEKDPRTAGQRNADALTQAVEIVLGADELPRTGGARPRMTLTIDYQQLRTELHHHATPGNHTAAPDSHTITADSQTTTTNRLDPRGRTGLLPGLGVLDNTQQPITPATARRLACDAEILPIVLGGQSQPLDIGRQKRTAPPHLRAALLARDGPCSFPGCDQPPGTSEAHHLVHWIDGGRTSMDNMIMLCGHHHRTIHTHGWEITLHHGRPMFTPPAWIDPNQQPRPGRRPTSTPPTPKPSSPRKKRRATRGIKQKDQTGGCTPTTITHASVCATRRKPGTA